MNHFVLAHFVLAVTWQVVTFLFCMTGTAVEACVHRKNREYKLNPAIPLYTGLFSCLPILWMMKDNFPSDKDGIMCIIHVLFWIMGCMAYSLLATQLIMRITKREMAPII